MVKRVKIITIPLSDSSSSSVYSPSSLLLPLLYEPYSPYALYLSHQVLPPSPSISTSLNPIPRCHHLDLSHARWFPCFCHHHCHPSLVPLSSHLHSAYFGPPLILICPPLILTYHWGQRGCYPAGTLRVF